MIGLRTEEETEEKPRLLDDSTASKARKKIPHIIKTSGFDARFSK